MAERMRYTDFPDTGPSRTYRATPRFPRRPLTMEGPAATSQFAAGPDESRLPWGRPGAIPPVPQDSSPPPSQFSWDPRFAIDPGGSFSGPQTQANLVQLAGRGGAFDPGGSPLVAEGIRKLFAARRRARERRALVESEAMAGDDPYLRNYARTNALAGVQGEEERALSEAIMRSILQNQAFLQDTTRGFFGGAVNRRDLPPEHPLAATAGDILGTAGGAAASALFL